MCVVVGMNLLRSLAFVGTCGGALALLHCTPKADPVDEASAAQTHAQETGTVCDGAERLEAGLLEGRIAHDGQRLYWIREEGADSVLESVALDGSDRQVLDRNWDQTLIGGLDEDWFYLTRRE